jgi:predicted transglutaminase-like cysteine proteinase
MQGNFRDMVDGLAPERPRRLVLGLPMQARRVSLSLLWAPLLAAMLAAPPLVSPSLAGQVTAHPQVSAEHNRSQQPQPMRLAALLPGENGDRALDHRSDAARPGAPMRRIGSSPSFATILANRQNVFGSVAVGMAGIASTGQWRRVLAEDAGRFFREGCDGVDGPCGMPNWPLWAALHAQATGLPARERIDFVNGRINRLVRYKDDQTVHGRRDHWATLTETVRAGAGDCEDYAIAKMWLLEALGVPLSSMQLVALRDERRGLDHAVLAVHFHDEILILDNVHDRVLKDVEVGHYKPMFSFAGKQSFVHGFRKPSERLAAAVP